MAGLAGTGTVSATAGSLRALVVVLADVRVLAFTGVAPAAVIAIGIDTAFGADAAPVIEIVAADETVTAVELVAIVGGHNPARRAFGMATRVIVVDARAVATRLALAALAVADAV